MLLQINTFVNEIKNKKVADLKKLAKISVLVIGLLSIVLLYGVSQVSFDYDFTTFYEEGDPDTQFFDDHKIRYGSDNDFVFISLENEGSVFETDFLLQVDGFVKALNEDSLVSSAVCLTNMNDFVKTPFSRATFKVPYLTICDTCDYTQDSIRIFSRPEISQFLINKDATGLMVRVDHEPYLSKKKCDLLKQNIDDLLAEKDLSRYHYAGRAIGQSYYIDTMKFETLFFVGMSFGLVIVFLFLSFRSWWGIWLPLIIVSASMLWIIGLTGVIGEPINIMLTVLPSIIFIVAMSDVIHLVSKYLEELRLGKTNQEAVKVAYKEVGLATLLTSITTAIGFLSLLTVPLQPVKIFGIYTALGVFIAFILAYTLLPALLVLVKPPKLAQTRIVNNLWYKILHRTLSFVIRRKAAVLISFIGIVLLGSIGAFQVRSNYFLLEDLKKDNPMRIQFDYFDAEYMGLKPFELSVAVKDTNSSVLDYDILSQINLLDSFLTHDYGLTQTFSLASVLKIANRTEHAGQAKYYRFPDEKDAKQFIKTIQKIKSQNILSRMVDSTERFSRVSSTMGDIGKVETNKKNDRLYAFVKQEMDTSLVDIRLTGTGYLLDKNMGTISKNLTIGLILAILIVSILMGFLYRSVKIVLIAIVPNMLPLLLLAAILGYFGIDLKVSTAIIFTIAFGIAVDDTIHFMSKFKLELNKGKSVLYALKRTYLSTGRAIVLTSLIICSGFLLLMFSNFLGTFYIGLLISLTLVFALLADLFLLPVLILFFFGKK